MCHSTVRWDHQLRPRSGGLSGRVQPVHYVALALGEQGRLGSTTLPSAPRRGGGCGSAGTACAASAVRIAAVRPRLRYGFGECRVYPAAQAASYAAPRSARAAVKSRSRRPADWASWAR